VAPGAGSISTRCACSSRREPEPARERARLGRGQRRGTQRFAEDALRQIEQLVLVHGAGRADHQSVRGVKAGPPLLQVARSRGRHGRRRAQDRTAEGLAGEGGVLGQLEDVVVGRVGGLGDLLGDDLLLALQFVGVERRAQHEVGDGGQAKLQRAFQSAHLETGPLIAGGGVDRAALALDGLDDLERRSAARALEHHVLQKMRPA
jgi:hypothetical protein